MFGRISRWWYARKFLARQRRLKLYFDHVTSTLPEKIMLEDPFPIDLQETKHNLRVCAGNVFEVDCSDGRRVVCLLHSDEMVQLQCDAGKAVQYAPLATMLIQPTNLMSFMVANRVLCGLQNHGGIESELLINAIVGHEFGHLDDYGIATNSGHIWAPTKNSELRADEYCGNKSDYGHQATICMLMCFLINPTLHSRVDSLLERLMNVVALYNKTSNTGDWLYDYECVNLICELCKHPELEGLTKCKKSEDVAKWHITAVKLIRERLPKLGI